jgi:hypothetical protein
MVIVSLTGCGNGGATASDGGNNVGENVSGGAGTGIAANNNNNATSASAGALGEVEADYANLTASEGLDIVSNGDGTCTIVGIGICKDKEIVIPTQSSSGDKVTEIDERAFADLKGVSTLYFIGNNIEIGEKAFQSSRIEKIVISGSEVTIDESAFTYSDDITEIYIGSSKVTVEQYAFYEVGDDVSVTFKNSEIELERRSFQAMDIKSILVDGCTLNIADSAICYGENIGTLTITNSTVSMDEYAFYDSAKKMVVTISGCDLNIDDKAFQSCDIKTLSIENCKTTIGESAFAYCEDLESLSIGVGSTEIDSYAFYDCTSLTTVSIGGGKDTDDNVIVLKDKAFQSCGVESVAIAGNSVEIGKSAFSYCEALATVTIGNGTLKVKDYAFYDCSKDLVITYAGSTYSAEGILKVK